MIILTPDTPELPRFRIDHRKFPRPNRPAVSVCRKHITGYHIPLSVYRLYRSMAHYLEELTGFVHFPL